MTTVRLRFWAALRDEAGTTAAEVSADTLAAAIDAARERFGSPRFTAILGVCTVMVQEKPVQGVDPADVVLPDGAVVDLLPPFAGG